MAARKRHLPLIPLLFLVLIPSVFLNGYFLINKQEFKGVKVIGVIDGNTIVLEGKVRLRLRQVDAPELEFCGGKEAKKYLEDLVLGKSVRLDEQVPDQYGRGMALVYYGNTLINKEIIKSGWNRYHHDVSSVTQDLKDAWAEAKENKLGVYGKCQSTEPENKKCIIKGNIDQHGVKKYYLPNCAQYKFTVIEKDVGESWFCTESEARKAGYVKAETCGK